MVWEGDWGKEWNKECSTKIGSDGDKSNTRG